MLELIIANKNYSSWSLRPWVLMTTLQIPFKERLYAFGAPFADPAFLRVAPTRRVPVLVDGDASVWDSLAITEYLAEHYPNVWPTDARARAWARSACAEMHSGFATLRNVCAMNCGLRVSLHDTPVALVSDLARIGELWAEGLARFGGPWLAGASFTAVDAFYAPVAFRLQTYGASVGDEGDAYAARLRDLPAMQQWYAQALAEVWRDQAHEADSRVVGTITADLRAAPEVGT
ncbi:MAG: glutathione S-transferase family protein [Burkholderiaceae bacterium]